MVKVVLTTIQSPTEGVRRLIARLPGSAGVVVAGDAKGPSAYDLPAVDFLSFEDQLRLPFRLPPLLPRGHYARKNAGYLEAVRQGAECIYETDDDSIPARCWGSRDLRLNAPRTIQGRDEGPGVKWVNVYRQFSDEVIWPRGFPLDRIHADADVSGRMDGSVEAPVQQGLVNGSPDVDAVWRLTMDRPFEFERRGDLLLRAGQWCPFNSQNTWWWPVAYPLMYIPSHCTFRMCDIWRSFVAQRCLWAAGYGVAFFDADVVQERNPHDLMRDFHDEIPGYEGNQKFVGLLQSLKLAEGTGALPKNMRACYEALVTAGFFPARELELLEAWLGDLQGLRMGL
jgi:hypothetical protein